MNPIQKKYSFVFLFTLLFNIQLFGQLENKIFEQKDDYIEQDTQSVYLHFESLNYLRNTEYFDIIEKGQTLFGTMLQAHLSYQPFKNIRLRAGIQTRQDYGSTRFVEVQPVFCLSIFKNKWRYNFGMLQGTTNYGFIEPMYNIDRAVTHRIENGIQGIYTGKKFYFNNFLIWNEPTYRSTTNQERFFTGITAEHKLIDNEKVKIALPYQASLVHRGGQLNSNPNPIYTRINFTAGLKLSYEKKDFRIRTENYWLTSGDFSPNITQPYKNGNASWHTLAANYKGVELMVNYWAGREYQSPIGTQIYNNYNFYNVEQFRQIRHMLMTRLMYTQKLNENVFFDFRFEPFYDFEYEQIQYSYSVYLRLNFNKFLGKI
jgi:hypothetical protein